MKPSDDAEQIHRLLTEFGKDLGLPNLTFSEEGTCALEHPSGLTLVLELSPDFAMVHWYSRICGIPSDNREAFFSALLETNLLGLKTNGASLGIDTSANDVLLSYSIATSDLDLVRMKNITDNFLESALQISSDLKEESGTHDSSSTTQTFDNSMIQFRV